MTDTRNTNAILDDLKGGFFGDIHADRLHRALYSTDGSIYEIEPDLVLMPRSTGDVRKAVQVAVKHRIPITARGAGTGLAGGAVNRGIQLDCSRYLNRIISIDPDHRSAVVEPGVVLDHLNAALAPYGLYFAPDVATSSRATIGGMIANNSCGSHSVSIGRTVDHVKGLDVVLGDGSLGRLGCHRTKDGSSLQQDAEKCLLDIVVQQADEIDRRFPKILRSNGGYGLDRLHPATKPLNTEAVICGSEGTLGIVTRATLNLLPLPAARGIVVISFDNLLDSLASVDPLLKHHPAAIELVDRLILDAARQSKGALGKKSWSPAGTEAILVTEVYADDQVSLDEQLNAIAKIARDQLPSIGVTIVTDSAEQKAVWAMRNAGLGLLMSRPGANQPYAFVEDSAVCTSRLRDYIDRFATILREEGVPQAGYYAHASVGCIHVRPVLDLGKQEDVQRMRRIADRVSSLALEFGGTMTGEHGDGFLRSEWLEKMYGLAIIDAFRRIKRAFDPHNILNPGKIVDPPAMTESLRRSYAESSSSNHADSTTLNFDSHGGMLGLVRMCSGVGQCRQTLTSTMCPSYMATLDERQSTRGRANALRHALTNSDLIQDMSDPALHDVMDLCLSCKACKTECPTGVDMAKLKAEWQYQNHQRHGAPLRSRLIASSPRALRIASHVPGITNAIAQSNLTRSIADSLFKIDRRVAPPQLASKTFRSWFEKHESKIEPSAPNVIYFVDTWTDLITPSVGIALVKILERLGYRVKVPPPMCCGRPAISQGLLDRARESLTDVCNGIAPMLDDNTLIVATEPSCLSVLNDELPQLVRTESARKIAERASPADEFILKQIQQRSLSGIIRNSNVTNFLLHGHCHQKAMTGTDASLALLRLISNEASEINSGCCGMAGAFGHEREHYDVANAVGDQRLFPAIADRQNADVAVTGFSCRHQIEHHTDATPKHVLEFVAEAIN